MNIYTIFCSLLTIAILFAYLNHRFVRMPVTIAVMVGSLLLSFLLLLLDQIGYHYINQYVTIVISYIDFHDLLINGMLAFLLFAGALNIDLNNLIDQKWEVFVLSTLSTIASTILVGLGIHLLFDWVHIALPKPYCFLFGALISPTDPIAVLAIFKYLKAPKKLSIKVEAESLFNDGIGIVLFMTLYQLTFTHHSVDIVKISHLFLQQAMVGIIYGFGLGILAHWLIKPIKDHQMEILITIAVVTGGYALAQNLNISGPLAMVTSGIIIGSLGRQFALSPKAQESLDSFWSLVDELLNIALFLLIGFELLVIPIRSYDLLAAFISIPWVLLVRYVVVACPISLFKIWRTYTPHVISIMTWGGLRGGLAVALALTIPTGDAHRQLILTMTYAVVLFSIVVQGLTIKPLIRLSLKKAL